MKPKYLIKFEDELKEKSNKEILDLLLDYHSIVTDDSYWPSRKEELFYDACLYEMGKRLGIKSNGKLDRI